MNANDKVPALHLGSILRDVQFWIPVFVLVGGIVVLWWIK